MELGIGLIAILVLVFSPARRLIFTSSIGGQGFTGILFRALLCVVFLLAPTVLMGATLPCAARWVESTPQGVSWLGILLYRQPGWRGIRLSARRVLSAAII